ncbi:GNAT family N-acetyltransferase [Chryseobacterium sp. JK1]|uniref:GNAT family N-acetyltransferase n=1 Tax=Chryseobacterium sp. JK1 TaxID=874294 RepID=UPI003D6993F4
MEFKTLSHISIDELLSVFNHSFSDYIVPFHLTKEVLLLKLDSEKLDLNISVGAFENDQLVSFILQAEKEEEGRKTIYNGGTGIVPEFRGKGLVRKMYDFIIPQLKERNAEVLLLEVIQGNDGAIRAYENLGFTIVRKFLCFNGNINSVKEINEVSIQELEDFQWEKFRSFWDIEPSWQGKNLILEDIKKDVLKLGAFKDEVLVGYIVYHPVSKKVYQIAVDKKYRNKGIGTTLFKAIKDINQKQPISFNNVDEASENTTKFLEKTIGLNNWVSQFEMKKNI